MSYYNPFLDVPPTNLNMLAGVASSLFAGRVLLDVASNSAQSNAWNYGYPGFTKTITMPKMSKKVRGGRKVATVATVKRMISGILEKKQHASLVDNVIPVADRDLVFTRSITQLIAQGDTDGYRVGDMINLESYTFNMSLISDVKASFYRFRVIVGWSGEEYNPAGLTKLGLGANQIFVAGGVDNVSSVINTKAFTPLYDQMIDINSLLDTFNDGKTLRASISLKGQKFKYQEAGSVYGKTKNLYMVVISNYFGPTAPATNIAQIKVSAVTKYTDA